jgi:hypothetical protein
MLEYMKPKRVLFLAFLAVSNITVQAQDYLKSNFEISVQAGAPTGKQGPKDFAFALGTNIRYLLYSYSGYEGFNFVQILPNTLSAKLYYLPPRTAKEPIGTPVEKKKGMLIAPVMIGTKFRTKRFVFLGELGYAYISQNEAFGAFCYNIEWRLNFNKVEIGLGILRATNKDGFEIGAGTIQFTRRIFQRTKRKEFEDSGQL